MNERAPGEVDALAVDADISTIIDRIRDNMRARQRHPSYVGFVTEEEAEVLFTAIDDLTRDVEESANDAVRAKSAGEDAYADAEEARADLDKANGTIRELQDIVNTIRTLIGAPS